MESALLLMQLRGTLYLALGATAGIVGAAGIAWLWSRFGHRMNLALFFQVTAIFLFVFVVQLLIRGTHEMAEQNYLPFSPIIHERTESWGPDSPFGHLLTYLLVILPLGWLLLKAVFSKRPVFSPAAPSVRRLPEPARYLDPTAFAFRRSVEPLCRSRRRFSISPGSAISSSPARAIAHRSRSTAPASPAHRRCRRWLSRSAGAWRWIWRTSSRKDAARIARCARISRRSARTMIRIASLRVALTFHRRRRRA